MPADVAPPTRGKSTLFSVPRLNAVFLVMLYLIAPISVTLMGVFGVVMMARSYPTPSEAVQMVAAHFLFHAAPFAVWGVFAALCRFRRIVLHLGYVSLVIALFGFVGTEGVIQVPPPNPQRYLRLILAAALLMAFLALLALLAIRVWTWTRAADEDSEVQLPDPTQQERAPETAAPQSPAPRRRTTFREHERRR